MLLIKKTCKCKRDVCDRYVVTNLQNRKRHKTEIEILDSVILGMDLV